ncbi:MAG: NAD(P)-dependent oxidoreductase [Cyclobacteriaceae bacterium]|nr:NAD(P)-dependent oxidoreductase [Cyclobacteriaceae bacterium]
MIKPTIKVLDTGYDSFAYEQNLFESNGYIFEIFPGEKGDVEGKIKFAADADGLLIRWTEIDDQFLSRMKNLKAIVRYGVGYDNIDLQAVNRTSVKVANVQGYGNHAVSDHALMLMYACNRKLIKGQKEVKTNFSSPPGKNVLEFHECTLGIIGLGRIGGTLCRKAVNLFRRVVAYDPYIHESRVDQLGAIRVHLHELMRQSDVISIHCNLTSETTGMLNNSLFAIAEKCPILINTARGPVIDHSALLQALENHQISSAGIDVYNTELAEELPDELINHPDVIATGHYAWYSIRGAPRVAEKSSG